MLYLAADHAGFEQKEFVAHKLAIDGVAFEDLGTFSKEMDDYPVHARRVAKEVIKHGGTGLLFCGTGVGMSIVANRTKGIRAAVVWNEEVAQRSRDEDDANIACLPARLVSNETAWEIVRMFLATTFGHEERYKRRVKEIDRI
ncbi:MAG: RpiB/LacA/LacB family sugar-phosphate isomerase [Candidatus Berkelbacteria bacterium]|nr:MAG: RpiB/LacA/LacB family sugar-phosphate isomerase [Candidatus Berkelbacteria bacterium]QQG52017.1 MAG: RpiB/LacA/LacB family sugar-phosphate isomerase [Candidatus Berkelbacteria bacterium]